MKFIRLFLFINLFFINNYIKTAEVKQSADLEESVIDAQFKNDFPIEKFAKVIIRNNTSLPLIIQENEIIPVKDKIHLITIRELTFKPNNYILFPLRLNKKTRSSKNKTLAFKFLSQTHSLIIKSINNLEFDENNKLIKIPKYIEITRSDEPKEDRYGILYPVIKVTYYSDEEARQILNPHKLEATEQAQITEPTEETTGCIVS